MEIYKQVLASIFRHFLTIGAGILGTYGVNAAAQSQLVEATVAILVSLVFAGIGLTWSYVQKRFSNELADAARLSPSTFSLEEIAEKLRAK